MARITQRQGAETSCGTAPQILRGPIFFSPVTHSLCRLDFEDSRELLRLIAGNIADKLHVNTEATSHLFLLSCGFRLPAPTSTLDSISLVASHCIQAFLKQHQKHPLHKYEYYSTDVGTAESKLHLLVYNFVRITAKEPQFTPPSCPTTSTPHP
jgi:hypothetical protein